MGKDGIGCNKMKKRTPLPFITISLCLLTVFCAAVFAPVTSGGRSICTAVFGYSDTGKITLTANGENIALNNIPVTLSTRLDGKDRTDGKITNNTYRFRPGQYGPHKISFTIPAALFNGGTDLACEVRYFANSGMRNDFDIHMQITAKDDSALHINGFAQSLRGPHDFNEVSKDLTEDDRLIHFYAPGP